uniref:Uncharacterized protein n=1 Tax=Parascaris equorum TaxID=6256 RepID=A0A914RYG0_PAREQ
MWNEFPAFEANPARRHDRIRIGAASSPFGPLLFRSFSSGSENLTKKPLSLLIRCRSPHQSGRPECQKETEEIKP